MGLRRLFGGRAEKMDGQSVTLGFQALSPLSAPERPLSARVLESECRIRELLVESYLFETFFRPITQEFYSICWGFPASNGGHHPGRLGLIEHSMGVVVRMLRMAPLLRDRAVGRQWDVFALHCVLAGLGHDLGKMLEWMVDSRGYDYHPVTGSVRDQGFTVVSYRDTGCHAILSTSILPRLLRASEYLSSRLYSPKQLGMVIDAIAKHHQPQTDGEMDANPYLPLLREADREDAAEDMVVVPTEADLSAREEEIIREREAVKVKQVEIAIRAIRLVLAEAKYGYSWYLTENGWLLVVSPEWTTHEGRGIHHEYQRLYGRNLPPYMLWSMLKDAGVMLPFEEVAEHFKRLRLARPANKKLIFAVFDEQSIFPDVSETEMFERYQIVGLAGEVSSLLGVKNGNTANQARDEASNVDVARDEVPQNGSTGAGAGERMRNPGQAEAGGC